MKVSKSITATTGAVCLLAVAAVVPAGCGEKIERSPERTVYMSLPTSGPLARRGRDLADGARLALDQTNYDTPDVRIKLRVLDSRDEARNLLTARADPRALVYITNREPSSSRERSQSAKGGQLPLPRITLAPATDATIDASIDARASVIHLLPSARYSGMALAQAVAERAPTVVRLNSDGSAFARAALSGFRSAVAVAPSPIAQDRTRLVLGTAAGSSRLTVRTGTGVADNFIADDINTSDPPAAGRLVTPALASRDFPHSGKRFAKAFNDFFGREPDRFAIFGYEAIGLALNAITDAGEQGEPITRASTEDALFALRNRFGPVGHYDVLPDGQTTLYTFGIRHWPLNLKAEEDASRAIEVDR